MNGRTLAALGWTDELEAAFTTYAEQGFEPARVVAEHRGGYAVRTERDDRLAHARGRLRDSELFGGMPTVGDWVVVVDAGERYAIEAVLPRRTKVSRKTPWLKAEEHVLVANVDTIFIVSGLDGDFNVRRLERYLATAWDSGAEPVVVLTKLDLNDDPETMLAAEAVAMGVPVHALSNVTGEGVDALDAYLTPARTIVLLGSSGVGKSTLAEPARGARADAHGRAATRRARPAHDAPPAAQGAQERRAADRHARTARAADLGGRPRPRVRRHRRAHLAVQVQRLRAWNRARVRSPGGARGRVARPGAWASYQKLQRELKRLAGRRNRREHAELKRRWRTRSREVKAMRRKGLL